MNNKLYDEYLEYISNGGEIAFVPFQYVTEELCERYILGGGSFSEIPSKFRNFELYFKYVMNGGNIEKVPAKFVTIDFVNKLLDENTDIKSFPKKTLSFIKRYLVKYEIINSDMSSQAFAGIITDYDISLSYFNDVLAEFKEENPELYKRAAIAAKENKKNFKDNATIFTREVNDIITSLGNIKGRKLGKEQKIQFAYLLRKSEHFVDFPSFYYFLKEHKLKHSSNILKFLNIIGINGQNTTKISSECLYDEENFLTSHGLTWLSYYNIDLDFKETYTANNTKRKYIVDGGEIVEIDRYKAVEIIELLNENGIPPVDCIVKKAFLKYANGQMDEFMDELNNLEKEQAENTKVKGKVKTLKK